MGNLRKVLWMALVVSIAVWMPAITGETGEVQELVIGVSVLPRTLEPWFDTSVSTARPVYTHIFDTLTVIREGALRPRLAVSWEALDDHTWQFKLRQDVLWHNGDEFTARDVKYSLDYVRDPANAAPWSGRIAVIEQVKIVDDYTVNIIAKDPRPLLPQGLTMIDIVPFGYYDDPKFSPSDHPIGTGAYRFVRWTPDDFLTLEANPEYWGSEPTIPVITYRQMPEAATRIIALETGGIDIAVAVPPELASRLEEEGFTVDWASIGQSFTITLSYIRAGPTSPLIDKRVRQALNYAIDKEAIVEWILGGYGRVLDGQLTGPANYGYIPDLEPYPYDPEKARELLARAGFPDGFTIKFDACVARNLKDKEIAEAIVGMLAKVGITVELNILESAVYLEKYYASIIGPMWDIAWSSAPEWSATLPLTWFQCPAHLTPCDYHMCNADFDDLYVEAMSEFDETKRLSLLHELQALFREEAPVVFLHEFACIFGFNPHLKNVRGLPGANLDFYEAYWEE